MLTVLSMVLLAAAQASGAGETGFFILHPSSLILHLAGGLVGGVGQTEPPGEPAAALEGLWPTERMIEAMIRRTALEAADAYDLTDEQRRQFESRMLERWPAFLREHRADLQPLVNEYFEARLGLEPPTSEQMQAWASRALPLAEELQQQIEAGNREIRSLLTPLQRVKFDSESVGVKAGLEAFQGQVSRWQRGEFTAAEVWEPSPGFTGSINQRAQGPASQSASAVPLDPIEEELDAWDRYVADFITGYGLDEGQEAAATSILRELKLRARAHRDTHRLEMQELEQTIDAGREPDEAKVRAALERLYGPIDAMFGELERRLDTLPTQAQRRAASQPAQDAPRGGLRPHQ